MEGGNGEPRPSSTCHVLRAATRSTPPPSPASAPSSSSPSLLPAGVTPPLSDVRLAPAAMVEGNNADAVDDDTAGGGKPGANKKKNCRQKDGGGGGEQQKAPPAAVVLRVDLHCHGCARKVTKAIQPAQGVEDVAMDMAASTVTVSGKADPWDLKERIESRAHKAVAFLSPPNPAPPPRKKPAGGEKNKPPGPESTVALKIRLHCNGCVDRIKRTAHKIKGVKQVTVDMEKEQVTVKGTMDAKALPDLLRDKLKREVVAVVDAPPPKKDGGGGGDKKKKKKQQQQEQEEGQGGSGADEEETKAEPQQEEQGGGGGKKKTKNKKQQQGDQGGMAEEEEAAMLPAGWSYRVEMLQAPQLFSDENPNACAVM